MLRPASRVDDELVELLVLLRVRLSLRSIRAIPRAPLALVVARRGAIAGYCLSCAVRELSKLSADVVRLRVDGPLFIHLGLGGASRLNIAGGWLFDFLDFFGAPFELIADLVTLEGLVVALSLLPELDIRREIQRRGRE